MRQHEARATSTLTTSATLTSPREECTTSTYMRSILYNIISVAKSTARKFDFFIEAKTIFYAHFSEDGGIEEMTMSKYHMENIT